MHLVQQSPEWHEFRKNHIGGSDISAIVGLSPWMSLHELWQEKTGRKEQEEPTYPMLRGLALEEEARSAYVAATGTLVMPDVRVHPEHGFCSASLDGITFDGQKIVEIKCPLGGTTYDIASVGAAIQPHYLCQIQWQLFVSGAESCDFYVYVPGRPPAMMTVTPDAEMQKHLLDAAVAFWDLVVNDVEPEKAENAPIMISTPEFEAAAMFWKTAHEGVKAAQAIEKEAKEMLLDQTDGGSCFGSGVTVTRIDGTQCVDWVAVKQKFNLTEEMLAPYTKMKAPYFRVSLLKEKRT